MHLCAPYIRKISALRVIGPRAIFVVSYPELPSRVDHAGQIWQVLHSRAWPRFHADEAENAGFAYRITDNRLACLRAIGDLTFRKPATTVACHFVGDDLEHSKLSTRELRSHFRRQRATGGKPAPMVKPSIATGDWVGRALSTTESERRR
jgi:hypothetical protein